MYIAARLKSSLRPAAIHLIGGVVAASAIAILLFFIWFPWPYDEFSGGRNLFLMLIGVDVVCGPLLTLVLITEKKSKKLLVLDISLVLLIQVAAMTYGLHIAWQARPIYLVAEIDRFKAITKGELSDSDIQKLPPDLRSNFWKQPMVVGIRPPVSIEEKNRVLFDSVKGGRDYAERPEFYVTYDELVAKKSFAAGRNIADFIQKYPALAKWATEYSDRIKIPISEIRYLPIVAREDWIAILDQNGYIVEFLKGEGF